MAYSGDLERMVKMIKMHYLYSKHYLNRCLVEARFPIQHSTVYMKCAV